MLALKIISIEEEMHHLTPNFKENKKYENTCANKPVKKKTMIP